MFKRYNDVVAIHFPMAKVILHLGTDLHRQLDMCKGAWSVQNIKGFPRSLSCLEHNKTAAAAPAGEAQECSENVQSGADKSVYYL